MPAVSVVVSPKAPGLPHRPGEVADLEEVLVPADGVLLAAAEVVAVEQVQPSVLARLGDDVRVGARAEREPDRAAGTEVIVARVELGRVRRAEEVLGLSATRLDWGCSRTTDSASWPGGLSPGPLAGEMPLPEVKKIRPDPSDIRPPSLCQMPAWSSLTPASSVHRVALIGRCSTSTPAT